MPLLLLAALTSCADAPACRVDPGSADDLRANGVCLVVAEGRVLAIRHRPSGKHDLPGGRRLAAETAQCAAHRETWEETGVDVVVGRRLTTGWGSAVYECRPSGSVGQNLGVPLSGVLEVADVEWVKPAEIADWRFDTTSEALRGLAASQATSSDDPNGLASPGGFEPPLPP